MDNPQFTITIMRGFDGGRVIYEAITDDYGAHESRLVFGGNEDEASRYVADRISRLSGENAAPEQEPRQIEPPVKARVRKQKPEPLAVDLDALELIEGEAD
jgi:hypothetical protein